MEVHNRFSDFELGGIYVLRFLLCHILRLSDPRGGRGVEVHTRLTDFELGGIYVLSYYWVTLGGSRIREGVAGWKSTLDF